MSKKITTLLILFSILAISLAACGSSANPVQDSSADIEVSEVNTEVADIAESPETASGSDYSYLIVETGQGFCYNADGAKITCPAEGEAFYGQDAQFSSNAFSFADNGNGTVTDNVTGLLWQQTPDAGNYSWTEAKNYCESLSLGGSDDWRMPSLKELFSISNFSAGWPYLDLTYFDLTTTDSISKDEQYWSSNYYVGKTAEGQYDAAFGVIIALAMVGVLSQVAEVFNRQFRLPGNTPRGSPIQKGTYLQWGASNDRGVP